MYWLATSDVCVCCLQRPPPAATLSCQNFQKHAGIADGLAVPVASEPTPTPSLGWG